MPNDDNKVKYQPGDWVNLKDEDIKKFDITEKQKCIRDLHLTINFKRCCVESIEIVEKKEFATRIQLKTNDPEDPEYISGLLTAIKQLNSQIKVYWDYKEEVWNKEIQARNVKILEE